MKYQIIEKQTSKGKTVYFATGFNFKDGSSFYYGAFGTKEEIVAILGKSE